MHFYDRLSPRMSSVLDLTRWLAAELVVISHVRALMFVSWHDIPPSEQNPVVKSLFVASALGHQSVIIFFVLSGFLVGGSVVADLRLNRFSPARYFVNRISRLYVVLLPALALGWALDRIGIRYFQETGVYTHSSPYELLTLNYDVGTRMSARVALANAINLQTIFVPTLGSNGPLWSLANEFWYYALFPALLLPFTSRQLWRRVAWASVALGVAWLTYPTILIYVLIWLLGVAVRFVPRVPVPRPLIVVPAMFAAAVAGVRVVASGAPSRYAFLADLALGLVFVVFLLRTMYERRTDPLVGARFHERLAAFSYSLYLLHFPFVLLACVWLQSNWGLGLAQRASGATPFLVMAALFVAANVYAWLVSRVTERHTAAVRRALGGLVIPAARSTRAE